MGKYSKFIGVYYDVRHRKWTAAITHKGKTESLGRFFTEREAAIAYDRRAVAYGKPTNILKRYDPDKHGVVGTSGAGDKSDSETTL
jgi:hypothetical protein